MHRSIAITLLVSMALLIAGCASATSDAPTTATTAANSTSASTPTTAAISISTSTPTVPLPTTVAPAAPESVPMSVDADGYHVIGDPAAPVVMTDYSDYF